MSMYYVIYIHCYVFSVRTRLYFCKVFVVLYVVKVFCFVSFFCLHSCVFTRANSFAFRSC